MKPPGKKADGDPRAPSDVVAGGVSASRIPPDSEDESPGVPGFHTWRGVYIFVFVTFVVVVAALALFSRAFA